jgi:hypothetical protein
MEESVPVLKRVQANHVKPGTIVIKVTALRVHRVKGVGVHLQIKKRVLYRPNFLAFS